MTLYSVQFRAELENLKPIKVQAESIAEAIIAAQEKIVATKVEVL
jgi:hypothetical protein